MFFITSGFFFLSNGVMIDAKVVAKIRHILKIIVLSAIFYSVFTILINIATYDTWSIKSFISEHVTATKIVKLFLTNDPIIYSHLWFLMALIYCYAFSLLMFADNKRLSCINILAPALLIGYACLQEFGSVLGIQRSIAFTGMESNIYFFNIFLFRALPFFLFGIILRNIEPRISKMHINNFMCILIAILGGVLAIIERFCIGESQFFVGTYISVAALFIVAINQPDWNIGILEYIGRELSLYVYILHIAIGRVIDLVMQKLELRDLAIYSYGRAFFILIISILLAQTIRFFKQRLLAIKA